MINKMKRQVLKVDDHLNKMLEGLLEQEPDDSNWLATMQEDLREIERNETRELMDRSNKKPIDVNQVYKSKLRPNSEVVKYKARLVENDFFQKSSIGFNEVYAPIARLETMGIIVGTALYK